tara:strand:+ start:355 stop:978 length:624 start_codon:yes stop_codon:yes gene_type:complete
MTLVDHSKMAASSKIKFDRVQALEAAMLVFWKKGYGAASLTDLTEAMGINKPSMYATFGNKEKLFVLATEHYVQSVDLQHRQFLQQANVPLKQRLKNYLSSVIAGQCCEQSPKGCYISLCVSEAAGENIPESALVKIQEVSQFAFGALVQLFKEDEEAKQLNLDVEAELHACFLMTLLNGTAGMARAGKKATELEPLLALALKGLGI